MQLNKCPLCCSDAYQPNCSGESISCSNPACRLTGPKNEEDGMKWNKLRSSESKTQNDAITLPSGISIRLSSIVWMSTPFEFMGDVENPVAGITYGRGTEESGRDLSGNDAVALYEAFTGKKWPNLAREKE